MKKSDKLSNIHTNDQHTLHFYRKNKKTGKIKNQQRKKEKWFYSVVLPTFYHVFTLD